MRRQAVIVVGCSYGDEGKGLAAAWAAREAEPDRALNVLINGGAQRGHTVDLSDGRRHVFHHFGSGTFSGAVSFADGDFVVNPLLFAQEWEELKNSFGTEPKLLISDRCRVTTPWDMMLGQILEEHRGRKRHGSCGCGIQETRLRYMNGGGALRWGELTRLTKDAFMAYCRDITDEYVPARLRAEGAEAGADWQRAMTMPETAEAAWLDLREMAANTERRDSWAAAAKPFGTLIFEAGQGLALDAMNTADFPYLTPSRTTSAESAKRIAALEGKTDTTVLYVTRSYLTRHGPGPFPTECAREAIHPALEDRTNVPNPHQLTLRYGFFDGTAVRARVKADLEATRCILPEAESAVLVTHLNETGGALAAAGAYPQPVGAPAEDGTGPGGAGNGGLEAFTAAFGRAFLSDCPWRVRPADPARQGVSSLWTGRNAAPDGRKRR